MKLESINCVTIFFRQCNPSQLQKLQNVANLFFRQQFLQFLQLETKVGSYRNNFDEMKRNCFGGIK